MKAYVVHTWTISVANDYCLDVKQRFGDDRLGDLNSLRVGGRVGGGGRRAAWVVVGHDGQYKS